MGYDVMDKNFRKLTNKEQLQLHQLMVGDYWYNKNINEDPDGKPAKARKVKLPEKWDLTRGIELYAWQRECLDHYFPSCRGIVKVVTGAGKTFLALALAQKIQNELNPALKVLITVPTIVLLNQWYDILTEHSNLPETAIGRLGGGWGDTLEGKSVLIAVNNSAVLKLIPNTGEQIKDNLMLIVDECHRLRGEFMRNVFEIPRAYCLGLSATPDVGIAADETDPNEGEDVVLHELGGIFYTLTYDDAIRQGFLPEFEIQHIGLPLKDDEPAQYRKVSDEITDLRDRLLDQLPEAPRGGELSGWAAMMLNKQSVPDEIKALCAGYTAKVAARQKLLFQAKSREQAVLRLVQERLKQNNKTQIILFHERIDEVMRLYTLLWKKGIPAVPEHSQLSDSLRNRSIELFRQGLAKVIVSGKALIEGFDAPSADIGINAASSASPVKAIQSIGRVLRKNEKSPDKTGLIVRFYIAGTTDEFIYKKTDFAKIAGAHRNRYFLWDPFDENAGMTDREQPAPPCRPQLQETELNWSEIRPGDLLDFEPAGKDYQLDGNNNLYIRGEDDRNQRQYAANPQNLLELLAPFREQMLNNYVTQTDLRRILIRYQDPADGQRKWRYCGQTAELFQLKPEAASGRQCETFRIKQFRGKKIIQQAHVHNGVARNIPEAPTAKILSAIDRLPPEQRNQLNTIFIDNGIRVFCRMNNKEIEICTLAEPVIMEDF